MRQLHYRGISDENESPDDIDVLFSRLRRIEPPPFLIARILARVAARKPSDVLSLSPAQPQDGVQQEPDSSTL